MTSHHQPPRSPWFVVCVGLGGFFAWTAFDLLNAGHQVLSGLLCMGSSCCIHSAMIEHERMMRRRRGDPGQ